MPRQQNTSTSGPGPAHYFDDRPTVPSAPGTVTLALPDLTAELATDRGVFSAGAVDIGTRFLLLDGPAPVPGDRHLVDLGCGYGPITIALATRHPDATVWAIDVNERARALTAANARTLGLENVEVRHPDEWDLAVVVDRIWSNPPIRVGKATLHDLLLTWLARLAPTGSAHLVVQKHLGADSLQRWLAEQGHATHRRGSRKAFRLLDVAPSSDDDHPGVTS